MAARIMIPTAEQTWNLAKEFKDTPFVVIPLDFGKQPAANITTGWKDVDKVTAEGWIRTACEGAVPGTWEPYLNLGIVCGKTNGILVVDVDYKNGGLDTWTNLISEHSGYNPSICKDPFTWIQTLTVRSGNGGYHYYFAYDDSLDAIPTTTNILPGIDIRSTGGQIVAPGCYAWNKEESRFDFTKTYDIVGEVTAAIPMPDWLYKALSTKYVRDTIELSALSTYPDPKEDQLAKLIDLVHPDMSGNYVTWVEMMFILHDKCTPENEAFRLELYHRFSSKSSKYNPSAVTKKWNEYKLKTDGPKKTLGSLYHWAKVGNPEEYQKLFVRPSLPKISLKVDHHCQYSPDDEYYLDNLILQFNNKRYEADSREEGYEIIKTDLINAYARFIRHIHTAKGLIIYMKENKKNPFALSSLMGLESYKELHCILKYEVEVKKKGQDPTKEIVYENIPIFRFIGISSDTLCIKSTEVICEPYHFDLIKEIDPDIFNIFPGYKARLVNNGIVTLEMFERIRPILKHIREVWACENNDLYYWILSWIAHPFVYLTKCGVALVVVGEQGCGKTIVFDFLEKWVIGELNIYTTGDIEEVTHHFNAHLKGITHCFINENAIDKKSGFAKVYTKLKNIITDSTITVTGKGKDTFREPNNMSLGFASNSKERPVHAEQGDRRYTITESSNKYKGNFAYFRDLADKCFNKETGDIFFTYLRSAALRPYLVDISKIPDTEARQTVLDKSRPRHEQFFSEVFNNGEIPINAMHILEIPRDPLKIFIPSEIFYGTFKEWHKKMCFYGDGCGLETFQKALPKHPGIYKDDKVKHKPKGCESRVHGVYIEENLYDTTMIDTRERDPVTAELLEPMTLREYVDRWLQGTSNKKI